MSFRSAAPASRNNTVTTIGHQTGAALSGGHGFFVEGVTKFDLLDMLNSPSDSDDTGTDLTAPAAVSGSTTETTDAGVITTIDFDDGSTLVVARSSDDDSVSTVSTLTEADGDVFVTTKTVTHLSDTSVQTEETYADGSSTTVTVDSDTQTRTVELTETDGDVITFSQTMNDGTITGQYIVQEVDGDTGTLTYSLVVDGFTQTLDIEGQTADGTDVDSIVVINNAQRSVTVTDFEGDVATFNYKDFFHDVHEYGLIGVIANVQPDTIG